MTWQRRINGVLVKFTGVQITRARPAAPSPSRGLAPAPAPDELVRPPADPSTDRLLVAPVFIMSPVRSGSTLLRSILNAHPDLHAPHELHVRRLTVGFGTPLARKAMEALGHNQADLEHMLWDRVLHRELVRSGKRTIVDKTPANAFAHARIAACWPDARFIFLLRHPSAILRSWRNARPYYSPEDLVADIVRYCEAVEEARGELDGPTVRYEDLIADPAGTVRGLCDFLGVAFEEEMLDYGKAGTDSFAPGLGDWTEKIRTGRIQPDLLVPDPPPPPLKDVCAAWGYPVA